MAKLKGKQLRHLRALGHALNPVVQIGREGLTPQVVGALDQALFDHELIKVKVGQGAPVAAKDLADDAAAQTNSIVCQIVGGTILLYREHPDEPEIELPR